MDQKTLQQNIIQELELENLPEDTQIEILTRMTESILKRITVKVLEQLSEKEKEEFDEVRETSDPEKINEFLRTKIANYDQILQEIVKEFKEEMKEKIRILKEK